MRRCTRHAILAPDIQSVEIYVSGVCSAVELHAVRIGVEPIELMAKLHIPKSRSQSIYSNSVTEEVLGLVQKSSSNPERKPGNHFEPLGGDGRPSIFSKCLPAPVLYNLTATTVRMAHLTKPVTYDIESSNIALLGSEASHTFWRDTAR